MEKKEVDVVASVSDLEVQWSVVPFTEIEIAGKESGLGWGERHLVFDIWDWGTWKLLKYKRLVNIWKHDSEFPVKVVGWASKLGAVNIRVVIQLFTRIRLLWECMNRGKIPWNNKVRMARGKRAWEQRTGGLRGRKKLVGCDVKNCYRRIVFWGGQATLTFQWH